MVTEKTTETVIIAAGVHGCEPGQIAKTLCIRVKDEEFLLVTKGDARLDNKKSKEAFGGRPENARGRGSVLRLTSHQVGGVCPFGLPQPMKIYLDRSLKVYDELIPAAGALNASVRVPLARLAELCGDNWVDACVDPGAGGLTLNPCAAPSGSS